MCIYVKTAIFISTFCLLVQTGSLIEGYVQRAALNAELRYSAVIAEHERQLESVRREYRSR